MKTDEAAKYGGFAAAVGPQEGKGLAACNIQVEPFDGRE
jgi:hypothetical protein